jgi:hypothetical protein
VRSWERSPGSSRNSGALLGAATAEITVAVIISTDRLLAQVPQKLDPPFGHDRTYSASQYTTFEHSAREGTNR